MNADRQSAQDDLAFMRAMVEEGSQTNLTGTSMMVIGGVLYGLQCLGHWAEAAGLLVYPGMVRLLIGFGPTVLFLAVVAWVTWRDRGRGFGKTTASRAIGAGFAGAGIANITLTFVFGFNAARSGDFTLWLFYPAVVCAIQGAVWFAFAVLRRRLWLGAVAAGWYIAGALTGVLVHSPADYLLVLALSMFLLLALPGAVMMRLAAKAA